MRLSATRALIATLVAVPLVGLAVLPALGQPANDQPGQKGPDGAKGRRPDRGGQGRSEWAEKYRQELREHPRMARALVGLHEVKDYMEKAPNDFGGHKAASIKACDEAIKELKEAIKFDAKREAREGGDDDAGGKGGKGGGGGGGEGTGKGG